MRDKKQTLKDKELEPAKFTKFMGSHHDRNQVIVETRRFEAEDDDWIQDIDMSIRRSKHNKSPEKYSIHNEMLKLEPKTMAVVILEMWRAVGKSKTYPKNWETRIMTTVYKKEDPSLAQNYRPLNMLSCLRKIVETLPTGAHDGDQIRRYWSHCNTNTRANTRIPSLPGTALDIHQRHSRIL